MVKTHYSRGNLWLKNANSFLGFRIINGSVKQIHEVISVQQKI